MQSLFRQPLRLWLGWVLWCLLAVAGHADPFVFSPTHLQMQVGSEVLTFHPVPLAVRVAKDPYLSLTDPTVIDLLGRLHACVTVSSDLGSVTAREGSVQSTWDVTAGRGTAAGLALTDPSATIVRNGEVVFSLTCLSQLLGLTLVPLGPDSYQLVSTLSALSVARTAPGRVLKLEGAGPITWRPLPNPDGTLALLLENTACKLPDRTAVGGVTVDVVSRGSATTPTRLQLTWDAWWSGQAGADGVLLLPHYPGVASGPDTRLTQVGQQGADWVLQGAPDSPKAYAWRLGGTQLTVDLVHCVADASLQVPSGVQAETLTDMPYGVTRLTFTLNADPGFAFSPGPPLTLHLGPAASFPGLRLTGFESGGGGGNAGGSIIVLDPGHGGSDPGAISPLTGLREKDVTLDVALKLQRDLEAKGWRVLMTRTDDRDLTYAGSPDTLELAARAAVADAPGVALFVSIHCNASLNPAARGTSIHWNKPQDFPVAQVLEADLGPALGIPMNGMDQSPFYVLRHTSVPAVLIETAYITNPEEGALLAEDEFRSRLATSIADSLTRWLRQTTTTTP